jgi:hypothetical protein
MYYPKTHSSKGYVLISAILIVVLLSGISVGLMYLVNMETRLGATDMDNIRAFYGAEAAMEKMMSDLNALYVSQLDPSPAEIGGLNATGFQPVIGGITYPQYDFSVPVDEGGDPIVEVRNISSGANEGLVAYLNPMTLQVTSRGSGGSEVKMEREIEVARIPVFQFGVFSETDLSYFPGPDFDFGGRVHTNGNLFLATLATSGLVFHNKITAVGEVIRAELANGISTVGGTQPWDKPVYIPTAPAGCDGAKPACRDLDEGDGSKVGGLGSADNEGWSNLSLTEYNGLILNGNTGATSLALPFISPGARAVELFRRPRPEEDPNSLLADSRLYNFAQIRVLISDNAAENPGGVGVRLANVPPYCTVCTTGGDDFGDQDTAFAEGEESRDDDFVRPPGVAPGARWPLIDGYLLVQTLRPDGSYVDVTMEWLNLGIARENADAILKFQRFRWTNSGSNGNSLSTNVANNRDDYWRFNPLGLYDTREGEVRDVFSSFRRCAIGGIMNNVELDVGNLRRWLVGDIGSTGPDTENALQNGYIFYFSDRRGMLNNPLLGFKTGEYGFEDIINPTDPDGVPPNGTLDTGEDVNENGQLDAWGAANLGDAFGVANGDPTLRLNGNEFNYQPGEIPSCNDVGRKNRVSGARHGLKLVNGALGNLPTRPDGSGGFTVASENMVYVQGNYNADNPGPGNEDGFGDPHAAAAIIADATSFLSNNWEDYLSYRRPRAPTYRPASDTYYRVAVAAGKGLNWPHPSSLPSTTWANTTNPGLGQLYGTEGAINNFLRFLEGWDDVTIYYKGSLVSLHTSEYATGVYKCCRSVYRAPTRSYSFDAEFLDPSKLPPGTPLFRDVVNLGFRQILTVDP